MAYTRLIDLGSHRGIVRSRGRGAAAPCQPLPHGLSTCRRSCGSGQGFQVNAQRVQPLSEMVLGPLERDPVRLEAGVNTRVVDLDHEVAVVIVWDLREYCVEVDHAEARLGPEPLAR